MIRVTVELDSARTGKTKLLGVMLITNRGDSDDRRIGNYRVRVLRGPKFMHTMRDTGVEGFRRLSRPVWDLVGLALYRAGYGTKSRGSKAPINHGDEDDTE